MSILDDSSSDEIEGIRNNIVDFHLKSKEDDKEKVSLPKKRKNQEQKEISLLKEEKEKRYYKKHIRKRITHKVKDIDFELKYNNKEAYKYQNIYTNYKNIYEVLILMKTKDGRKLGVFTNNILLNDQNTENDESDYVGYVYNNDNIYEIELTKFFMKYGNYLQNIYDFLISEKLSNKNKNIHSSSKLLGDIELFEIYQVKYIR